MSNFFSAWFKLNHTKITFFFWVLISLSQIIKAQDTILIDENLYHYNSIHVSQYYYCDTDSATNFEIIKSQKFSKLLKIAKDSINTDSKAYAVYGIIKASSDSRIRLKDKTKFIWLKIKIKNVTNHEIDFFINRFENDIYLTTDNKYFYKANHTILNKELAFLSLGNIGSISLGPNEVKTIFLKRTVREYFFIPNSNKVYGSSLQIQLWNKNKDLKNLWQRKTIDSWILGGILILVLYNFLVFLSLKKKIYAYYFLYIIFILFPFLDEEIKTQYVNDFIRNDVLPSEYCLPIAFAFYSLFIVEFLNADVLKFKKPIRFHPKFVFAITPVIIIVFFMADKYQSVAYLENMAVVLLLLNIIFSILIYIAIIYNSIIQVKKGFKPARYILLGSLFIIASGIIWLWNIININQPSTSNYLIENVFVLGIFSEALIFSLGINNKINVLQKEKEEEQQNAIIKLEEKVKERTAEVVAQKELVEYQNHEILDSIEYAKRIQATILPPPRIVKKYFDDSFILYLPKDIVAGDFYWMESIDEWILFAACDCTGHGVPGALVSVVCHNALNRAVKEYGLFQPSLILDKVSELVEENFSTDTEVKDGMDASICALNTLTGELFWAGANNPLWLIKNNAKGEIIEYKANKQPIGQYEYRVPYTNHKIEIEKDDILYIFSDGYADQFGGERNRKLTKLRFRELLLNIASMSLEDQRNRLLDFHLNYKKNEEQVDDILIMGVRI